MANENSLCKLARSLWELLPPDKYPSGLSTYSYMWQYRASVKDYISLLEGINGLDFSVKNILSQNIDGYLDGTTTVARVIAFVISEWYKREASSLDGDRAMEIFTSDKMPSPEKIWKAAGFNEALLHKAKKMSLRQTAMCVLGGFPLIYVNGAENRFEALINKLSEEDEENDDTGAWDKLFDDNNSVFSGSLRSGSCKAFVDSLWKYLESEDNSFLPFNPDDLGEEAFSKFCALIRNGYDKKVREDFFKETHLLYTSDEDTELQAQIRVQIGFKKDNHILYASQLEKLSAGINTATDNKLIFRLKAYYADGTFEYSSSRCYNKIGNHRNDYVSTSLYPLSIDYDFFNIDRIELLASRSAGKEKCLKSFSVGDYLELYSTNTAYCWSTRKRSHTQKAILFNYEKFQDFGNLTTREKRSDFNSDRPIWNWIPQDKSFEIKDVEGRVFTFKYNNTPQVQVSFSYDGIDKSVHIVDGKIAFCSESDTGRMRLLFGKGKKLNISISGGKTKGNNDFFLEYREAGKYRYTEWTESSSPQQGFLSIRISTNKGDRLPYTTNVYYIPSVNPVERDLQKNEIRFNNVCQISAFDNELKAYAPFTGKIYIDTPPSDSSAEIRDTVSFRIGASDNYIILEIYRAFFLQELIRNGLPFKHFFSAEKREIPVLLQKDLSVRTINEEGCMITSVEEVNQIINDRFSDGYFSSPILLCSPVQINDAVDIYIYKALSIDGKHLNAPVSPRHYEQYRFFFWKGYCNDAPVLLPSVYNDKQGVLSVDCSGCDSERGVIFQSRKDCVPNNYFRPYYVRRDSGLSEKVTPHIYAVYTSEDVFFAYKLFREHKTYAAVFSPFLVLRNNRDKQTDLLSNVLRESKYHLTKDDIRQLTRLADESGFEWLLTPRRYIQTIVRQSGDSRKKCISSLQRLFADSAIVKNNYGEFRYEKYYFKRIFIDTTDYFDSAPFDDVFKTTRYRQKKEARTFVEFIKGKVRYDYTSVRDFKRKTSDYSEYITLFHDIFYQYVINK